jgi:hypothetical protein
MSRTVCTLLLLCVTAFAQDYPNVAIPPAPTPGPYLIDHEKIVHVKIKTWKPPSFKHWYNFHATMTKASISQPKVAVVKPYRRRNYGR